MTQLILGGTRGDDPAHFRQGSYTPSQCLHCNTHYYFTTGAIALDSKEQRSVERGAPTPDPQQSPLPQFPGSIQDHLSNVPAVHGIATLQRIVHADAGLYNGFK